EAAHGSAFVHDGEPVRVGLAGREAAIGEVRERHVEADHGARLPLPVRAVTGRARLAVDLCAAPRRGSRRSVAGNALGVGVHAGRVPDQNHERRGNEYETVAHEHSGTARPCCEMDGPQASPVPHAFSRSSAPRDSQGSYSRNVASPGTRAAEVAPERSTIATRACFGARARRRRWMDDRAAPDARAGGAVTRAARSTASEGRNYRHRTSSTSRPSRCRTSVVTVSPRRKRPKRRAMSPFDDGTRITTTRDGPRSSVK